MRAEEDRFRGESLECKDIWLFKCPVLPVSRAVIAPNILGWKRK
jgi:hypothetical protein